MNQTNPLHLLISSKTDLELRENGSTGIDLTAVAAAVPFAFLQAQIVFASVCKYKYLPNVWFVQPFLTYDSCTFRFPAVYPPLLCLGALQARKLWDLLEKKHARGEFSHTFGALDPVQVNHKPSICVVTKKV